MEMGRSGAGLVIRVMQEREPIRQMSGETIPGEAGSAKALGPSELG